MNTPTLTVLEEQNAPWNEPEPYRFRVQYIERYYFIEPDAEDMEYEGTADVLLFDDDPNDVEILQALKDQAPLLSNNQNRVCLLDLEIIDYYITNK